MSSVDCERLLRKRVYVEVFLIFAHPGISGEWYSTPDTEKIQALFRKYRGTVLMCLNGHLHTDHLCVKDEVAYFDVNAVINGYWAITKGHHYLDGQTFLRETIDENGRVLGEETFNLNKLTQGKNTWFFDDLLSAIVEIEDDDTINIEGSKTFWEYGILPPVNKSGVKSEIKTRRIKL